MYKENKNKIMIKEWRRIDGITVMNKTVINKGPAITVIQQVSGKEIKTVKVKKVKSISDHKVSGDEISAYEPSFKKVKGKGDMKTPVTKPDKFVSFKEVKKIDDDASGKEEKENKDKSSDKQSDEKGKENKKSDDKSKGNVDKEKKKSDDGNMKDGNKNKDDKGKQKDDKGKQKDDKGDKQKDDKGGKDKGKDKGKK